MTQTKSIREVCRASVGIDTEAEKGLSQGQGKRPIRQVVEESVGIRRAATRQQSVTVPDLSGLKPVLAQMAQVVAMAERAVDKLDQIQAQQPVVKAHQVAAAPSTWGQPQPIPMAKTGPQGTGYPDQAQVIHHPAKSARGMAAAQLAGPDPTLTLEPPRRQGPSIRTLVRRSIGLHY